MVTPGFVPRPITRTNYPDIVSAEEVLPCFKLAYNRKLDLAIIRDSIHQFIFIERGENGRVPGPAFIIEAPANPRPIRFNFSRIKQKGLICINLVFSYPFGQS